MPSFIDYVFEGYNAKLPDEINAYKSIDNHLKGQGFDRKQMPTAKPQERRFLYWKDDKRVTVTVYYAGGNIRIEIPGERTEAELSQEVLPDFVRDHLDPYTVGKQN